MDLFTHPPTHTLVSMPIIQNQKYQSPVASRLPQPQKQVRVYFRTYLFLHPLPSLTEVKVPVDLKKKKRGTAVSKNGFIHPPTHPHTCIHAYYTESKVSESSSPQYVQATSATETSKSLFLDIPVFTSPPPPRGEGARRLKENETWNCRQ